jgi:hypothetical protein
MDTMELAQRAIAELAPLGDGLSLRAAMQAAENDALHLRVSAPPRRILSSERSAPCPATARAAVAPQRLRMAG